MRKTNLFEAKKLYRHVLGQKIEPRLDQIKAGLEIKSLLIFRSFEAEVAAYHDFVSSIG